MLITCPNCETTYEVEEAKLGPSGRAVRCAQCGETWRAMPEAAEVAIVPAAEPPADALADSPDPVPEAAPAFAAPDGAENGDVEGSVSSGPLTALEEADPQPPAVSPFTAFAAAEADAGGTPTLEGETLGSTMPVSITPLPSARIRTRRLGRAAPRRLAFGAVVVLGILAAVLVSWRVAVVRVAPQTARLYAILGLPVNLRGLAFEGVTLGYETADGVPVMVIEGAILNTTKASAAVPRLRFAIRNAARLETYAWTALPAVPQLAAGESVAFRTRLASPPSDARDVLVRFHNRHDLAGGG